MRNHHTSEDALSSRCKKLSTIHKSSVPAHLPPLEAQRRLPVSALLSVWRHASALAVLHATDLRQPNVTRFIGSPPECPTLTLFSYLNRYPGMPHPSSSLFAAWVGRHELNPVLVPCGRVVRPSHRGMRRVHQIWIFRLGIDVRWRPKLSSTSAMRSCACATGVYFSEYRFTGNESDTESCRVVRI